MTKNLGVRSTRDTLLGHYGSISRVGWLAMNLGSHSVNWRNAAPETHLTLSLFRRKLQKTVKMNFKPYLIPFLRQNFPHYEKLNLQKVVLRVEIIQRERWCWKIEEQRQRFIFEFFWNIVRPIASWKIPEWIVINHRFPKICNVTGERVFNVLSSVNHPRRGEGTWNKKKSRATRRIYGFSRNRETKSEHEKCVPPLNDATCRDLCCRN